VFLGISILAVDLVCVSTIVLKYALDFSNISVERIVGSMRVDSDRIVPWASDIIGTCGGGSSDDGCIVSEEVVWSDSRERT
jgi:hypothetical protein